MERRKFSREFKLEAVNLVCEQGVGTVSPNAAQTRFEKRVLTNLLQSPVSEWIPLWQLSQNGLRIFCKVIESGGESFFAYLAQQRDQQSTPTYCQLG